MTGSLSLSLTHPHIDTQEQSERTSLSLSHSHTRTGRGRGCKGTIVGITVCVHSKLAACDGVKDNFFVGQSVVVAQLVERSLPMPEIRSSKPVLGAIFSHPCIGELTNRYHFERKHR